MDDRLTLFSAIHFYISRRRLQMKKKLLAVLSLIVMCAMMIACVTYDGKIPVLEFEPANTDAATDEPVEINIDVPIPETEFHIEPIEDMTDVPLVELHADWTNVPVYAVLAEDETLMLYTSAHEEHSGDHGFLNVYIESTESDPVITVDYKTGFVALPELAQIDSYEPAGFVNVVVASAKTRDPLRSYMQQYYVIRDTNEEQIGIVSIEGIIEKPNGTGYEAAVEVADEVYMYIDVYADESFAEEPEPQNVDPTEAPAETTAPVATEEPAETKAPENTTAPTASSKPTATTKPTPKPTPKPTAKPTNTPKPTPTLKPTATPGATPTPHVWTCKYCGKTFGSTDADYEAWYQHAWYNPGCYAAGHAVTPVPATPTPRPGGHYEDVWVVDVPRVSHTVWHCNVCGWETSDPYTSGMGPHQSAHLQAGEKTGYHSYIVVDQEEQGHWETVWVPDP